MGETEVNLKVRNILIRYTLATSGLLLVAIGVALSIIANLGTSPLSAPGYVLSGIDSVKLSIGTWTIIFNTIYIFIQLGVFRKRFKAKYLMQIPASIVFGYLIDFSLWMFSWLAPAGFLSRLVILVLSCFVTAMGVSVEVVSHGWMLSAEMTVYAIAKTYLKPFDRVKVIMDVCHVFLSSAIAFLLFRNPFGFGEFSGLAGVLTGQTEGVVIGLGTVLMAILAGGFMKITDPIVDRIVDTVIDKAVFDNVETE